MSGGMHDYTLTIEWRDGATKTTTIRSDDPQRFIRALSADRDVVEAHVDPLEEWDAAFAGETREQRSTL